MNPVMPPRKNKLATNSTVLTQVTEPVYGETERVQTRADKRRSGASNINGTNLDEVFGTLMEVIGVTDISEPTPDVTSMQIDTLAAELVAVRNAKDLVEGRESALKAYATEVINMRIYTNGDEPAATSGFLVSPENGVKLSKEVSGGKLVIDVDKLETVLDAEQFSSVTNLIKETREVIQPDGSKAVDKKTYREVNEEALEKQLKLGNIGMEQIVKATMPGKVRSAFYVRSL